MSDLHGIRQTNAYYGDSARLYGEEYTGDMDGKRPIAKAFGDTHGKRIWQALQEASSATADKAMPILNAKEESELLNPPKMSDTRANMLDDLLGDTNTKVRAPIADEERTSIHVEQNFSDQSSEYDKVVKQEIEDYKTNFAVLSNNIATREKELQIIMEKFNSSKDPEEKLALFAEVSEKMNEMKNVAENFGKSIVHSDKDDVVDALSDYDNRYDEDMQRKVIKNI